MGNDERTSKRCTNWTHESPAVLHALNDQKYPWYTKTLRIKIHYRKRNLRAKWKNMFTIFASEIFGLKKDDFVKFSSFAKIKAIEPSDEKAGIDFVNLDMIFCHQSLQHWVLIPKQGLRGWGYIFYCHTGF